MTQREVRSPRYTLEATITEFGIPPVHDALVLGKDSPIGCVAIRKAIELLVALPFEHIELEDEVLSDLVIRQSILRRIPRDRIVTFVLRRIKPLMEAAEILHLDLKTRVVMEEEL